MFTRLFAETGLSLDRLKALLEVGVAGSIVKAAGGDPVRQSQYSRQIKELEDFFGTRLIERQGRGTRLTPGGRELARISRFFLLGLSNFQRGCRAEEQTFRVGAGETSMQRFLIPAIAGPLLHRGGARYVTETVAADEELERRLHDLTLDFGLVGKAELSRPLQSLVLGEWPLELWVPRALRLSETKAAETFGRRELPVAWAVREMAGAEALLMENYRTPMACGSFAEALTALYGEQIAALLPAFLAPSRKDGRFVRVSVARLQPARFRCCLAWNPRLLRLNPHAARRRDQLAAALSERMPQGSA